MQQAVGVHGWLLLREALLLTSLLGVYQAARFLGAQHVASAFGNSSHVLTIEFWLHLPREQSVQALMLSHADVIQAANMYYAGAHLPMTAAALVWLFIFRPSYYVWARRALLSATGAALLIYLLFPVAPPRMLSSLGFVDTGRLYGQSVYGPTDGRSLTNQFAAMPSLHVGWAVLIATVCIAASSSRWRWLWVAHPVCTLLVVVSTGNHYWLDGLAGAALVCTTLLLTRQRLPLPSWRRLVRSPRAIPAADEATPDETEVPAAATVARLDDLYSSELVDTQPCR